MSGYELKDPNRRRTITLLSGVAVSASPLRHLFAADKKPSLPDAPYRWSLQQAVSALHGATISAAEYAEALISRFERRSDLNVFIARDDGALMQAAREADVRREAGRALGSLHGIPILLKDNIETTALPTSGGTTALKDYMAGRDADIASRLFMEGALLAGKANMHELAASGGRHCVAEPVRHPHDRGLRPGGSSSGCGAAVAAGMVPAAIGTDTGGSVRVPSALCGIAGLRPTVGRYSPAGIIPISRSRDTAGPMARSVADLVLLDRVLGDDKEDVAVLDPTDITLGIPRQYYFDELDSETAKVTEAALDRLSSHGIGLVEVRIDQVKELAGDIRGLMAAEEIGADLPAYLSERGINPEEFMAGICDRGIVELVRGPMAGGTLSKAAYEKELGLRRGRLLSVFNEVFKEHGLDALVFPTCPLPARPAVPAEEVLLNGKMVKAFQYYNRNVLPGSSAAMPGTSQVIGSGAGGLPIALALDGLPNRDRHLLAVATAIEKIIPPPEIP